MFYVRNKCKLFILAFNDWTKLECVLILSKESGGLLVPDNLRGKPGPGEWERFLSTALSVPMWGNWPVTKAHFPKSNLFVFTLHLKHLPVTRLGPWLVSEHKMLPTSPLPQPVQSGAGMLLYFGSRCDKKPHAAAFWETQPQHKHDTKMKVREKEEDPT